MDAHTHFSAPDIVLTAAHCYRSIDELAVRTNPHNLNDPLNGSQIFPVVQSVVYPNSKLGTNNHDFGILKLNGTSALPLVRVNSDPQLPQLNESLTVGGWGVLEYQTSLLPHVLQVTNHIRYISNNECVNMTLGGDMTSYAGEITDDVLCAYGRGYDACQGDSGTYWWNVDSTRTTHYY